MPQVNRTPPPEGKNPNAGRYVSKNPIHAASVVRATVAAQAADGDDPWGAANRLSVLVYGQSGTGKTTFAATFPGRTLWLLCSGGHKPGELRSIDTPENRRRIRAQIIRETGQLSAL